MGTEGWRGTHPPSCCAEGEVTHGGRQRFRRRPCFGPDDLRMVGKGALPPTQVEVIGCCPDVEDQFTTRQAHRLGLQACGRLPRRAAFISESEWWQQASRQRTQLKRSDPMHALEIGKLYHPGVRRWPEGGQYNF